MKRVIALLIALVLVLSMLAGCGKSTDDNADQPKDVTIRVGSMKGPTSMGLVSLMDKNEKGTADQKYEFIMETAADALLAKMVKGELDIAMLPANVASILYNKTEGGISVIEINTLGVLYIVSDDETIDSIDDLKGKTVYLTGKGQTPDYNLQYVLKENGLTTEDVQLEYKSEATEVAAALKQGGIGLLPQPFVTSALSQNENLKIVLDMTEEWDKVQGEGGSSLVTGVTVVRNEFLAEYGKEVAAFLKEYEVSTNFTNQNVDEAAELIAELGIVAKAPLAKKAIPYCNITFITGEKMKTAVSGYLQVLFEQNPESVGGKVPAEAFYWLGN